MRRFLPATAVLFIAGCATAPTPAPVAPAAPAVIKVEHGNLIGLTASDLGARFGQPRIQIREGDGTKLQFVSKSCVLDAYLYPPPGGKGLVRVTHIDTRARDGRDVDQARCASDIEAR